jgi:hypothetical protein
MTPFILGLEPELDVEWQRFNNQWLFPWHNLNIEGRRVDVEDFRGGRITVGGIVFQGQIQSIYWQSIGRYLNQKILQTFKKWDEDTKMYPREMRLESLERTEHLLRFFIGRVVKQATETDRALRGRGFPQSVPEYSSSGAHSAANATVHRLIEVHTRLIAPPSPPVAVRQSLLHKLEVWYSEHKGLTWAIGIAVTIVGLVGKAFFF